MKVNEKQFKVATYMVVSAVRLAMADLDVDLMLTL